MMQIATEKTFEQVIYATVLHDMDDNTYHNSITLLTAIL